MQKCVLYTVIYLYVKALFSDRCGVCICAGWVPSTLPCSVCVTEVPDAKPFQNKVLEVCAKDIPVWTCMTISSSFCSVRVVHSIIYVAKHRPCGGLFLPESAKIMAEVLASRAREEVFCCWLVLSNLSVELRSLPKPFQKVSRYQYHSSSEKQ